MRHPITIAALSLVACGGSPPAETPSGGTDPTEASEPGGASEAETAAPSADDGAGSAEAAPGEESGSDGVRTVDSHTAKDTHGVKESTLKPSKTEAVMKFVIVNRDMSPIQGVVVSLAAPDGKKYYTEETDAKGYAEVLVPNGTKYDVVFVSLGSRDIAAKVEVGDEPNLTQKLTVRYKGYRGKTQSGDAPRFVLDGVHFDTGKATIRKDSYPRLDRVVEYMSHKTSARIEISGHTDNVGNKKKNKDLSERRAKACRDYLIKKGIDGSRIEAVGHGDEKPVAPNDTAEGRQRNRRIEAREL